MLAASLYIAPIAALLGQAPPNAVGFLVAASAFPAVLLVDAAYKRYRGAQRVLNMS
jgi:hypothetical protein